MLADNYTPIDRAYNATLRLVNQLHHIRDLLKEGGQILEGDVVFESVNGLGDIVQQMDGELVTLEWMIKDVEEWWKPLELMVSEAVGRLKIEAPPDSVTWTQHVLDKAWRAWNGMNIQLGIHKDADKVIRGMIDSAPQLEALPCLADWNQRITKEFRAGGVPDVQPRLNIEQESLGESLDPNSANILETMLELDCNELNRLTADRILRAALHKGDKKRAFKQLQRLGLVASTEKGGRYGGYWLTTKGLFFAQRIQEMNSATVTPIVCTV
jgi:predicted transcriptional regulator